MSRVLLVDDNEINLGIYRTALRRLPEAECVTFTSSREALDWVHGSEVHVVVVDYDMPAPDGLEFIRLFRANDAEDVPVVMVTASEDRAIRRSALELGATDFLNKPVDPLEFRARIKNMLALAESRRQLKAHNLHLVEEVRRATAAIHSREREMITKLMTISEFRDNETGRHIERMGYFSAEIGAALGLNDAECEMLLFAAPMHDIGKISVPDSILLKPGKLTPDEWIVMKQHTVAGYDILKDSQSPMLRYAAEIALSHHERYDGTGYPSGLSGETIPLSGRICAVADVFDALTSARPYKEAWTTERALEHIRGQSGTHFDPKLVDAFDAALPKILAIKEAYVD
jgi:putative two-component system response regulator